MLPVLTVDGVRAVLNGRDTIWLDSLDEALAREAARDTVVSALRAYRGKWPAWVRFVATSRPDEATRRELGRIGKLPSTWTTPITGRTLPRLCGLSFPARPRARRTWCVKRRRGCSCTPRK